MEWDNAIDYARVRAARRKLAMGMYDEPDIIEETADRVDQAMRDAEISVIRGPRGLLEIITPAAEVASTGSHVPPEQEATRGDSDRCVVCGSGIHRPDPGLTCGGQGRTANATAIVCAVLLLAFVLGVAMAVIHAAGWLQ